MALISGPLVDRIGDAVTVRAGQVFASNPDRPKRPYQDGSPAEAGLGIDVLNLAGIGSGRENPLGDHPLLALETTLSTDSAVYNSTGVSVGYHANAGKFLVSAQALYGETHAGPYAGGRITLGHKDFDGYGMRGYVETKQILSGPTKSTYSVVGISLGY